MPDRSKRDQNRNAGDTADDKYRKEMGIGAGIKEASDKREKQEDGAMILISMSLR